jgi:hypothetical protein
MGLSLEFSKRNRAVQFPDSPVLLYLLKLFVKNNVEDLFARFRHLNGLVFLCHE